MKQAPCRPNSDELASAIAASTSVDRLHHHHRAERLLAHQPRVRRRFRDDRRAEDAAVALGLAHELRALGDRIRHHRLDPVGGGAAHHRADVDRVVLGIADLELVGGGDEQLEEFLVHRALDDHALRRDALLPARLEAGAGDAGRRVREVGVGADDVGGVRAQLADEFLGAGGAGKLVAHGRSSRSR